MRAYSARSNETLETLWYRRIADGLASDAYEPLLDYWDEWLPEVFPEYFSSFADHHAALWDWVWSIQPGVRPRPFVAIWPRSHGKSTSAETAAVAIGALQVRNYVLYVSETQPQADDHVENITSMLESPAIAARYPGMSVQLKGKFGNVRGWRRSRVRTASGLNIDAFGLDAAMRGIKLGQYRPDVIICDDLDHEADAPAEIARKVNRLTKALFPTGARDVAILMIQNLVHAHGIFAQLSELPEDGGADWLADRIISGPVPAIEDLEVERVGDRTLVTDGKPTWSGFDLQAAQREIDTNGITSFMSEFQHRVRDPDQMIIKREWFTLAPTPPNIRWVRGWDLAASVKTRADRTASVRAGFHNGRVWLSRPKAFRMQPSNVKQEIKRTILAEPETETVAIESNAYQIMMVTELRAEPELLRASIVEVNSDTDKLARASGWITRAHDVGIMLAQEDDWSLWLDEWEDFGQGAHDDRVDAVSIAYQRLIEHPPLGRAEIIELPSVSRWDLRI